MRVLAQFVSLVLHPLLVTTYLVLVFRFFMPGFLLVSGDNMNVVIAFVFLLTFVLPAVNLLILRSFGTISSLTLFNRSERLMPFVFIGVIYVIATVFFFWRLSFLVNLNKVMLIVTIMILVATIVTLFFKMSIHSLAMGGVAGILIPLNQASETGALLVPTAVALALTGAVMSARLALHAHTFREVWHGAWVGLLIGITGVILLF
ncbi:MAG: hypothetical protein ACK5DD_04820 [Cyclobacteriaceae bacterium]